MHQGITAELGASELVLGGSEDLGRARAILGSRPPTSDSVGSLFRECGPFEQH
jgi:hypothetical protein